MQLLIGFSQGSASNIVARIISPALSEALGDTIHITPLPGENGALAAERLARAAPDGQTLGIAVPTHVIGSLLDAQPRYDPITDFAPVALFAKNPLVLTISSTLGVRALPAFIALAKSRPDELVCGASAVGGAPHLASLLFSAMTGVQLRMRLYAETNTLYDDLAAGKIALTFNNTMSALPLARHGKITLLGATSLTRGAALPDVPTLAESALPGYDIMSWVGLLAPAATPAALVERINKAVSRAVESPSVRETLISLGMEPVCATPAYFGAHLRSELARWEPFVREHPEAFPGARASAPM